MWNEEKFSLGTPFSLLHVDARLFRLCHRIGNSLYIEPEMCTSYPALFNDVRESSKNSKARLSRRRVLEINSEFRWCRYLTKLSHFHFSAIKPVILFGDCSFAPRIILSPRQISKGRCSRFSTAVF